MRSYTATNGNEPAIARCRTQFTILQRSNQIMQPIRAGPRVGIDEYKDFALRIGCGDGGAKVVDFLPAVSRRSGNHKARCWSGLTLKRSPRLFDNRQGRIARMVADENGFKPRIVLRKDRANVFCQAFLHSPTWNKNGGERRELLVLLC